MTTSAPALSPVSSYAHAVISGESIACKWVRLACERHMRDLERAEAGWLYYFDDATAEWAINFFRELLKHSKGEWAGQALKLAPWQCFIVGSLFGWKRRAPFPRVIHRGPAQERQVNDGRRHRHPSRFLR